MTKKNRFGDRFVKREPRARTRLMLEPLEDRNLLNATVVTAVTAPVPTPGEAHTNVILYHPQPGVSNNAVPAGGYTPTDIKKAYGFNLITDGGNPTDGTGETIAIIDAYNDPNIATDLASFDSTYGLPGTTLAQVSTFFSIKNQTGGNTITAPNSTTGGFGDPTDWSTETSLDVEWVHALAPGAKIILVEGNSNSNADLLDAAAKWAGTMSGAQVVSMSFGVDGGFPGETAFDSDFAQPAGYGVTYLASTGDSSAPGGYPAESPNVVAVGGTSLTTDASGNYSSETTWGDGTAGHEGGGGGVSTFEAKPTYQQGVAGVTAVDPGNSRATPDVSFDADPNTGVPVIDTWDGLGNFQVGGTSFAAPAWASLVGITDGIRNNHSITSLAGASQTLPALYNILQNPVKYSADFHDVTTGSNGHPALTGYDLATGIGTPIANTLVADLAGVPATGTITGRVFNDVPHAGLELASDPGLANWTVYIDQTNAGHFVAGDPTALTAANGTYTFTNVAAGTVQVGEIVKPNFVESVPTSGGEQSVTVVAATTTPGVDFGDFQIVTPTVYDDSNLPANFQLFGSGWKFQNVGVSGESRYHAGTADPSTFAQWTTSATQAGAGAYELYATWPAKATDATNATYQIFDQHSGNFLGSVTMDQTKAPTQANVGGTFFQKLGTFSSSNGSFVIKLLTDGANGNVVADAVMEASPPLGHNQKVLFYAGDFDASNPNSNALANERNTAVTQASTFQNFVVPVGQTWTITGLYSNDFLFPGTTITGADWSIHSGVSSGNGGSVIASASNAAANLTATGRTDFGLTEDSVAVSGLHVVLGPGTYWMNVTPVGNGTGRSFNSNTFGQEQVGSDIADQQFWNSSFFGANFVNADTQGTYPNFSDGVIGSDPVLSGSPLLGSSGAATAPAGVSSGTPSASTGAAGSPTASLSTANLDSYFALLGAASSVGASSGPVALLSGNGAASASGAFSTAVTHVSLGNSTASVDDLFAALAQRKHGSGPSDLG